MGASLAVLKRQCGGVFGCIEASVWGRVWLYGSVSVGAGLAVLKRQCGGGFGCIEASVWGRVWLY